MPCFFEEVDGVRIYYEKVGTGPHVLLLIPAAIGCGKNDFINQLNGGLDQHLFTMIAIDLPGWGRSRPPERKYKINMQLDDARMATGLMDKLGYKLYSVLGWCYGSQVGMLMAIKYQACVDKLVVLAGSPYKTSPEVKALSMIRDVSLWDAASSQACIDAYGHELFRRLWEGYIDNYVAYSDDPSAYWDVHKELRTIRCPTLILHGARDPLVDKGHPYRLEEGIPDSQLFIFPSAKHEAHNEDACEFNRRVTSFLLE